MRVFAAMLIASIASVSAAKADVTFCNKTSKRLGVAVAARIDVPTPAWEATGWWILSTGECAIAFEGNYSRENVYYYARLLDDRIDWEEDTTDVYPVCVPEDGSAFKRRGSGKFIQTCPSGWIKKDFYNSWSDSRDRIINFVGI